MNRYLGITGASFSPARCNFRPRYIRDGASFVLLWLKFSSEFPPPDPDPQFDEFRRRPLSPVLFRSSFCRSPRDSLSLSLSLKEISRPKITLLQGVISVSPSLRDSRVVESISRLLKLERISQQSLLSVTRLLTRIDFENRAGDTCWSFRIFHGIEMIFFFPRFERD